MLYTVIFDNNSLLKTLLKKIEYILYQKCNQIVVFINYTLFNIIFKTTKTHFKYRSILFS